MTNPTLTIDTKEAMRNVRERIADYQASKQAIRSLQRQAQAAIEEYKVALELQNTCQLITMSRYIALEIQMETFLVKVKSV